MMATRLFSLLLSLIFLELHRAELFDNSGVDKYIAYASEGEPFYITCPLISLLGESEFKFNITWYKNDSKTQITADPQLRIHQDGTLLKFFPARLEDTEFYACVLRNVTFTIQKLKKLEVYKKDEGFCYSKETMYEAERYISHSNQIDCPEITEYLDVKNAQIKWFKECQPLDFSRNKYLALEDNLYILNATLQDGGNYTCEVLFEYNATEFTISRFTRLTLLVLPKIIAPAILSPSNNILEVELGSPISLACTVTYSGFILGPIWTYNRTSIKVYYNFDKRLSFDKTEMTDTQDGETIKIKIANLNFSEVKEEDYDRKFFCEVFSPGRPKAYVMLKRPDPSYHDFLSALFVSLVLLVIIVILTIKILKVDIVIWYRSSCFAQMSPRASDGKLYDAYIMYPKYCKENSNSAMDTFVLKVLPEVLERQCSYRLFIFGRDEVPGQAVVDLINETISNSRRLVIVLGNTFSENRLENDFEQQIAMYDALIRNKIKVILIELGKITDYMNMPESIKYIKRKQGVVRWKGDFTETALSTKTKFWKNIIYRMPSKRGQALPNFQYISQI